MANLDNTLKSMRSEVQRSKRWRSNKGRSHDDAWRRFVGMYKGEQYAADQSKLMSDRLVINMIFATVNVMVPAVALHNPRFVVHARKHDGAAQAIITEEVLNYLWQQHKFQRDFRLAALDFILIGHGWLKTGYKATKPPKSKASEDVVLTPIDDGGENEGVDDREDVEGNVESELNFELDDDRPFLERISPFDMFCDPDARHPKEMRWIAQRVWRPIQDVNVDSRYSATNRKKVSSANHQRWDSQDGDARNIDGNEQPDAGIVQYAEIIEYYDIKRNTVATFSMDGAGQGAENVFSGFLIKPKTIPYALGHPFSMIRNFEVPDHFYPIGDVEQIESLQLELNETRNQMFAHRKRFARKWVYKEEAFDRDGIGALEADIDNVFVPVREGYDVDEVMAPVPAIITPVDFYDQSGMITMDLDRVSGISDYDRGGQSDIKRTATEAAMIQDAANARAQDRLVKIEQAMADAGERIIALMQQYLTEPQVARITTMPVRGWIEYQPEWIQGKFDYEVMAGSTEPRNETFRRQSAMQLMDATMPFLEMGIANPIWLYQKVLQDGFGIKDTSRAINPQVMQQAEQGPPPGEPAPGGGPPPGAQPPGAQGAPPPNGVGPPPVMAGAGGGGGPPPGPPIDPQMLAMMEQQMMTQGGAPPAGDIPPELAQLISMMPPGQPLPPDIEQALMMLQGGGVPPGM